MATVRKLNCKNEWWDSYGERVLAILEDVDKKRFQNTYDGDVNYTEIVFILQGLMFALEKTQNKADEIKGELLKINSYKEAIETLNNQVNELKKELETEKIENEVTIANLEHELEKEKKKTQEDVITD